MTTLVTGGSGYTASALAKLLHDAKRPFIVASRSGHVQGSYPAVTFDFVKPETYGNPFQVDASIDRVYIVPPPARIDVMPQVNKFIDFAISKGVKRIVLLSSTRFEPDDATMGIIHKHILETGVDHAILRPSWFMQNFSSNWGTSIRDHNQITSAMHDGRIPMVSTTDIAQAAFDALTAEKSPNNDIFVLGPELVTHDEALKIMASVLGREITHKKLPVEQMADLYAQFGMDPVFAKILGEMERKVAQGDEEALFTSPTLNKFIGKQTLREYIEENKDLWIKA